jgi:hypothetical protein
LAALTERAEVGASMKSEGSASAATSRTSPMSQGSPWVSSRLNSEKMGRRDLDVDADGAEVGLHDRPDPAL